MAEKTAQIIFYTLFLSHQIFFTSEKMPSAIQFLRLLSFKTPVPLKAKPLFKMAEITTQIIYYTLFLSHQIFFTSEKMPSAIQFLRLLSFKTLVPLKAKPLFKMAEITTQIIFYTLFLSHQIFFTSKKCPISYSIFKV